MQVRSPAPRNTANKTGAESLYTTHGGFEIMYHVSTLLPYSSTDAQQVRARFAASHLAAKLGRSPQPSTDPAAAHAATDGGPPTGDAVASPSWNDAATS